MPSYIMEEVDALVKEMPFKLTKKQVVFYDPHATSEYSEFIENNLSFMNWWFRNKDYDFCYIPDICKQIDEEQIRYLIPNWKGGTVEKPGNDLLKPWIPARYRNTKAGFVRIEDMHIKFFPLLPLSTLIMDLQLDQYRDCLIDRSCACSIIEDPGIMYSVVLDPDENRLFPLAETKISLADKNFSEEEISAEIKKLVERLHKEGFEEFVLRCMVPAEKMLSRMVITKNYDIVLPDYNNMTIEMSDLPKAVFFLFLKHEKGLYFKDLVDYRDELRRIYEKITNRTSTGVIDDSIDKLTNPLNNSINEKCSRIRESFVKHIDKSLAESYYISGTKSQAKRITLPRNLVEWQCEI